MCAWRDSIRARDMEIGRPLYYAVISGKMEIIEYLLIQGADMFGKNNKRRTPKEDAGRNRCLRWETMVDVLKP